VREESRRREERNEEEKGRGREKRTHDSAPDPESVKSGEQVGKVGRVSQRSESCSGRTLAALSPHKCCIFGQLWMASNIFFEVCNPSLNIII
jgi:hypothetical protein